MNALTDRKSKAHAHQLSLEDMLARMTPYGCPHIHCHDDGTWSTSIDMTVNATGAKFSVRSEFRHPTAASATTQCLERMLAALKGISENPALTAG